MQNPDGLRILRGQEDQSSPKRTVKSKIPGSPGDFERDEAVSLSPNKTNNNEVQHKQTSKI
jgi:hypothetical protein